jgi:hypothetical protein
MFKLPKRIFDLYTGKPASGKSESIARLIEEVLRQNPTKKARIVVGDGSSTTYEHLLDTGRVELAEFYHREYPTKTLRRLSEGWWPSNCNDPNSELIPPDKQSDITDIVFYAFEGLSVGGKYILGMNKGGLAWRAAQGEKMGPEAATRWIDGPLDNVGKPKEDDSAFGTNGTAHYMAAQQMLVEIVQTSRGLISPYVVWTAHEAVAEQQTNIGDLKNPVKLKTGEIIVGPEVAGKALTPVIQRCFGNMFHFQTLSKKIKLATTDEMAIAGASDLDLSYRIWTRDHFAVDGQSQLRYVACTRSTPATFPAFFENNEPGMAILDLYHSLQEAKSKRTAQLTTKED